MRPTIPAAILLAAAACSVPPDEGTYQTCIATAYARAYSDGQRLCPSSPTPTSDDWDKCKHRAAIMRQLQADEDVCRG